MIILIYSKTSNWTASSWTDLVAERFSIGSKKFELNVFFFIFTLAERIFQLNDFSTIVTLA